MADARTPVFIYHGFFERAEEVESAPPEEQRYYLSVAQLEAHLSILRAQGAKSVTTEELGGAPATAVALTFDDGHISNHRSVWPRLTKDGHRATFFIVANWVGRPDRVGAAELREMRASGMSIGSHGLNHRRLDALDAGELERELRESKDRLEQIVGAPVRQIALPGGFSSPAAIQRAWEAGYEAVCCSVPGYGRPGRLIRRLSIVRQTSARSFAALARGRTAAIGAMVVAHRCRQAIKSIAGVGGYERLAQVYARTKGTR